MKAVVYKGTKDVAVEEVPDPTIQAPTDAIIRITTTNICERCEHDAGARTLAGRRLAAKPALDPTFRENVRADGHRPATAGVAGLSRGRS